MPKLKNLYFFLVVLYSGMSLGVFRSHEGLIALWAIGLLVFWKETIRPHKMLFVALAVWMGYFAINTLIIRSFHPMFMGTYIAKIMIAYWLITYYREEIFIKFENSIYYLTIISFCFYLFHLDNATALHNIIEQLDLSADFKPLSGKNYVSIGIYTINGYLDDVFPRNSGFCWEPGPFSSYVVLAMFINIARNGVSLKDKKRLLLFLVSLITTQSSTGMIVLLAIIIWYAWSSFKNKAFRILSVPISAILVIYLFITVPWLQEKIITETEQDINEVLAHASRTGSSYAPGRFASFYIRWEDFKNYPIAGFGGNTSLQVGYLGEDNVVAAINGLGSIMGRYGSIGVLFFLTLIFRTGYWLSKYYHYSGHIIFPVLILMIGFGFGIIESPVIVTLWMVPVFLKKQYKFESVKK